MSLSSFASAVLRGMIQTAIPLRTHFALKVIGAIALWVVGRALISTEVEAQLSEFACSRAEAAVQPVNPCRPPHEFAIGSAQRPEDRLWPDQGRRVTASSGFRMAYTRSGFCGARPGIATGAGLTEEIDDHVDATQPVEPRHERTRTSTSPCPHQPPHRELSPAHSAPRVKRLPLRLPGAIGPRSHGRRSHGRRSDMGGDTRRWGSW
jgi:hypothetical protein